MAKLTSLITFSGSLDNISVYEMAGVSKPIVRKKGGAKREKILRDPCFANTRRNMGEFTGRSVATRYVLEAFTPLRPGHGTTGILNKVLRAIQKMDTQSLWGQRCVALSLYPRLLQDFDISKRLTLDEVIKNGLTSSLSREERTARVEIPALLPGVNCLHPKNHPFFRVMAVLGVVPDLFYQELPEDYVPQNGFQAVPPQMATTPWRPTTGRADGTTLELTLPQSPGIEAYSLLLSVAIEYGRPDVTGAIEPVPRAVASKIVTVG